jgi:monoamine oxidase
MSKVDRREFLRNAATAGVELCLAGSAFAANPSPNIPATRKKVVVAGARISGLCCAYELMRRGHAGLPDRGDGQILAAADAPGRADLSGSHAAVLADSIPASRTR